MAGTSATYRRITKVDLHVPEHVSPEAADLIKRVSPLDMMQVRGRSYLKKLLRYNPEDRLPLKDVLIHPWVLKYQRKKTSSTGTSQLQGARQS